MWRRRLGRTAVFWIVVAAQVATVLVFAGWREIALRTGTEVVLATVPADPRDVFRGDYVVLRYQISTISSCYISTGSPIYVGLTSGPSGTSTSSGWSNSYESAVAEGSGGPVIRGLVKTQSRGTCTVDYGIESYFVPEGKGREIERFRGNVRVHVVIDGSGDAQIKGLELP